jgi:hypothetical protein
MSKSPQPPQDNGMHSKSKVLQSGRGQLERTFTAVVNTVTLSGSQRGSSLGRIVTTAAHSDTVYDDQCTRSQQDAGQIAGNTNVPERITQFRDEGPQV